MPAQISGSRLSWLERESVRWRDAGIIDDGTRARILQGYQVISTERRSLMALVVIAVLMCGIGLLLLIGYNWNRIPATVKITMILAAVGAAFGGAAIGYARTRHVLGETLAFAGTILFGNGIWLIAQVLHIRGHFPDAFFWFGVGAFVCAWLVESTWIGVEAAILFAVWLLTESSTTFSGGPIYTYIPLWALCIALAYRLASPVMLCSAALTGALWIATATADADSVIMPAAVVLGGCLWFAIGRWRRGTEAMQMAWRVAGLFVLLIAFVPLMVTEVHRTFHAGGATATSLAVAVTVALIALTAIGIKPSTAADAGVAAVAAIATIWASAVWSGMLPQWVVPNAGTVAFSALAIAMGLSLIRTALHSHGKVDLAFGVLFALAFLLVRWVSVIENMLWSGAFLIVTGGGLLMVARLWRSHRRPDLAAAGRLS